MKIVFLSDDFPPRSFGGAGMVAFNLAQALRQRGHDLTVITTSPDRADAGHSDVEGVPTITLASSYHERWRAYRSLWNPPIVRQVERLLRELRPDVVHGHNVHYHLSYESLRRARHVARAIFLTAHDVMLFHYGKLREFIDPSDLSTKRRYSYHVTPWQQLERFTVWYNPFRNIAIHRALRSVNKVFAVSEELQRALAENGIGNVAVIHNGVDPAAWTATVEEAKTFSERFRLQGKHPILFSGRLSEAKGGTQVIRALPHIIERDPAAILLVIGKRNAYAESLLQLATRLGLNDHIRFTSWLSGAELHAAFHAAAVAVAPSVCFDTFGLVAAEAMACGKPVVVSCFGGLPELVEEGRSGFVVNPYNLPVLAETVASLTTDATLAKRIGAAAAERIRTTFTLGRQADETLAWYDRILSRTTV